MKVIGLTGGIGSGKSTVAGYLAKMGAVVMDLDKVGHDEPSERGSLSESIGEGFLKRVKVFPIGKPSE